MQMINQLQIHQSARNLTIIVQLLILENIYVQEDNMYIPIQQRELEDTKWWGVLARYVVLLPIDSISQ